MRRGFLLVSLALAAACSAEAPDSNAEGNWVGTVTTEGDVTTVVNESGSVWGGTATVVEELSIGVEIGDDPYMFGSVRGIAMWNELIFVLDGQVPIIRVFDSGGSYVRSIGQGGQGPGEFERPSAIEVGPEGQVFVKDANPGRILVFGPGGEVADPLRVDEQLFGFQLITSPDGRLFADVVLGPGDGPWDREHGVATVFPSGAGQSTYRPIPDFGWTRWLVTTTNSGGGSFAGPVPFAPTLVWTVLSTGAIAAGVSDRYRFELRQGTDHKIVVEKYWTPIPVKAEEGEWRALRTTLQAIGNQPDWTWNGPEVPEHKPAYQQFHADRSGRLWVLREGAGVRDPECVWASTISEYFDLDPCWTAPEKVEVFGADGRFLGDVSLPAEVSWYPRPYIKGHSFLAVVEDAAGTIMVKRYRLVLPGEEEPR